MAQKHTEHAGDSFEIIEESLTRTEQFIEDNRQTILSVAAIIAIVIAGYFAYVKFVKVPKELEAQSQIFTAERYFEMDSLNLALNGDGNAYGFLQVINEYGSTKTGNLASYYAGVSYLKMGQFDLAIEYLGDYSANDRLIAPIATGSIGDAYLEKGDLNKAVSQYKKAANMSENAFSAPIYLMKAGVAYEELNQYSEALNVYKELKQKYPSSAEARKIDKYISRAQQNL